MPEPQYMKKTLEELNLGSYHNLAYVGGTLVDATYSLDGD